MATQQPQKTQTEMSNPLCRSVAAVSRTNGRERGNTEGLVGSRAAVFETCFCGLAHTHGPAVKLAGRISSAVEQIEFD